jgi:cyclase
MRHLLSLSWRERQASFPIEPDGWTLGARCFVTLGKKVVWLSAVASLMLGVLAGRSRAQQQDSAPPVVAPRIPQPIFRAPENTWKTGVNPNDIKAGVIPDFDSLRDKLVVIPVQGDIYMIGGAGANIALQVTDEGLLIVDSGDARAADKVIAELNQHAPRKLRWIIDTSADLDHTGGNEMVAKAGSAGPGAFQAAFNGAGAGIIAHEKVLDRMSEAHGQTPVRATDAQPTDTFFTARKTMFYGRDPIELLYQPAAHSDGDVMVWFRHSDVVAAGDVFSVDRYPVIHAEEGGSMQGMIDGLNRLVEITIPQYNEQGGTRVIPGHGWVANQSDVVEYRDMATIVRDRIALMAKKGMTLEQVKAAHPTLEYDGTYGHTTGPWTTDMFIDEVYREASKAAAVVSAPAGKKAPKKAAKG